jgi:hypothetical protein
LPMMYIHVTSIFTVGFGRIGDVAGRVSDVGEVFQRPESWMRFLVTTCTLVLDSIRLELIWMSSDGELVLQGELRS